MSLLLHYKFDDTNVTLDSSGNNKHLTNVSGVTTTIDSTHGRVALFNGSNYLMSTQADNRPTGSPRTISVWVYITKSQNTTIFDHGEIREERFVTYIHLGKIGYQASFVRPLHPNLSLNRWYHIAVAFDGSNYTIYQDGVMLETIVGSPDAGEKRIGQIFIGRLSNFNGYFFNGKMADLRLYDYGLDSTEISSIFSSGPGEALPLVPLIPGTIQVQGKASTKISCLVEGDPSSTYRVEVGGQTIDDIKAGETVVVDGLASNTEYTVNLY